MFAEATVQKSGNTLHVSHGNDAGLFVEFTTEAVHQPFASTEAGRPIYKDVPHIMILFPGDKTKKIFRAAKIKREDPNDMAPTDAERFPAQWAAFQKGAEQVMVGTPLSEWPPLTKAQCAELKAANVHTVEQLADMPDTGLVWFGARETREAARVWISKATDASAVTKLARANDVLTQQVIALMEQVKELGALAEANANEAIKRGPGRPKGS